MERKPSFRGISIVILSLLTVCILGTGITSVFAEANNHVSVDRTRLAADPLNIIYVNDDAGGANNGTAWTDAYKSLQDALDDAGPGSEIWVAKGTYFPTEENGGSGSRYRSFQMKNEVAIYGGFDGTENPASFDLEKRNFVANAAILSGDLNKNGRDTADAYNVFYHPAHLNLDSTAILDGFTITGGYASGDGALTCKSYDEWNFTHAYVGGGMYNDHCSPTLIKCTFSGNATGRGKDAHCSGYCDNTCYASPGGNGAGIYNINSSPILIKCTFSNNVTGDGGHGFDSQNSYQYKDGGQGGLGAAIYNDTSSPEIINCIFSINRTGNGGKGGYLGRGGDGGCGGAIYNYASAPWIIDSIFKQNQTGKSEVGDGIAPDGNGGSGGAIYNLNSSPEIIGCIFTDNRTGDPVCPSSSTDAAYGGSGGAIYNDNSPAKIANCIFWKNRTGGDGTGCGANRFRGDGGALCNRKSNATIVHCVFYENSASSGGGIESSLTNQSISNCILWGNIADDAGDQIYASSGTVTSDSSDIQGYWYWGEDNISEDPLFANPATGDFHLRDGSPCIDAGSEVQVPDWLDFDFEGDPRIVGFGPDMGVDETRYVPVLITHPATDVEEFSAILNGEIDDMGQASNLKVSFEWGPNPGPPYDYETSIRTITAPEIVEEILDNIIADKNYYFRIKAIDNQGKSYFGVEESFLTLPTKEIIYVNDSATGAGDGSSWVNAFTDLQEAIDFAGRTDEVWVAEGVYKPTVEHGGSGERYRSFQMKNLVDIYGGFPDSGDPRWFDRNWEEYLTILSGDVGVEGDYTDNCYHVFYHPDGTNLNETAVLDGFIITGSYANGSGYHRHGGGMFNDESSPSVTNCTFTDNFATDWGGGMYNRESSPSVAYCIFSDNTTRFEGGGMYNFLASPEVENCIFSDNVSQYGGGMGNREADPFVSQCEFSYNEAVVDPNQGMSGTGGQGGGMHNWHSASPEVTNCNFTNNIARHGGAISDQESTSTINDCDFTDNQASNSGGGLWTFHSQPKVSDCIFTRNSADFGGGIYNWSAGSEAMGIEGCQFESNEAIFGGGIYNDQGVNIRVHTCQFTNNEAHSDDPDERVGGGAICNDMVCTDKIAGSVEIEDCQFTSNRAYAGQDCINPDQCGEWAFGGAICNLNSWPDPNVGDSSLKIQDSTFMGNGAYWGGAVSNRAMKLLDDTTGDCNPTLSGCTFKSNFAVNGGGICNEAFGASSTAKSRCNPVVTNCRFITNGAHSLPKDRPIEDASRNGGGISNYAGAWSECSPLVTNCIFSGNHAFHYGGGISNYAYIDRVENNTIDDGDCAPRIVNCTFYKNLAWGHEDSNGGGMSNQWSSPHVSNSIFWNNNNPYGGDPNNIEIYNEEASPSYSYCDIETTPGSTYDGIGNINEDPLFQNAANDDFHLKVSSPCIDAGDSFAFKIPLFDFDGDPRQVDVASVPDTGSADPNYGTPPTDIGADEYAPAFVNLVVSGQVSYPEGSSNIIIKAEIKNEGNVAAVNPIGVHFFYCDISNTCYAIQDLTLDGLSAKGTAELSTEWIPPVSGEDYTLKVVVDPVKKPPLDESFVTDNVWEDSVTPGNPIVNSVTAEWDGLPGQSIGVFLKGIDLQNTFTALVESPDPGVNPVVKVTFELDGKEIVDTNPGDGWSATFNMGRLDPGVLLGIGKKILTVRAYDDDGHASPPKKVVIQIMAIPEWLESALTHSKPLKIGWLSGSTKWNAEEHCFHFDLTIKPENESGDKKEGEEKDAPKDADGWGLGGKYKFDYPEIGILFDYYLYGKASIGGSVKFEMDIGEHVEASVKGGMSGAVRTSTLELTKLVANVGATLGVTIPLGEVRKQLNNTINQYGADLEFDKIEWSIEGEVTSEIVLEDNNGQLDVKSWEATGKITQGPTVGAKIQDQSWCVEGRVLEQVVTEALQGEITLKLSCESKIAYNADTDSFPHLEDPSIEGSAEGWMKVGIKLLQAQFVPLTPKMTFDFQFPPAKSKTASSDFIPNDLQSETGMMAVKSSDSEIKSNGENTLISSGAVGQVVFTDEEPDNNPVIASNGSDHAIAMWIHSIQTTGIPATDIYTSFWDGNTWSPSQTIEVNDNTEFHPSLIYVDGTPMAIWASGTLDWGSNDWMPGSEIYSSMYLGNEWTAPERITDNGLYEGMTSLASVGSEAIAVWVRDIDNDLNTIDDRELYYSFWSAGLWSDPEPLTNNSLYDGSPHVAAKNSDVIAVWVRDLDGDEDTLNDQDIYYALWDGFDWSAPQTVVSDPNVQCREPYVTYNPDGDPVAVWIQATESIYEPGEAVYFSTLFGGSWDLPHRISDLEFKTENPGIAFDASNNALVVWNALISSEGNTLAVTNLQYAVMDGFDQSWSPAQTLTDGDVDWQPSMAMLDKGAMIVWLRHSFIPLAENGNTESTVDDDDVYYLIHPITPDFEVTSNEIILMPGTPALGEEVQIDAVVHNSGDLDSDPTIVQFFVGDPSTGYTQIGSDLSLDKLEPGASVIVTSTWTMSSGTHEILVLVDPEDMIAEFNEENNAAVKLISLLPDFIVGINDISFSNDNPLEGDTVTIEAVVHNIGGYISGESTVRIYDGDLDNMGVLLAEQPLGSLGVGENLIVSIEFADLTLGRHDIYVVVDEDNYIEEYSDDNNTAQKPLIVSSGINLAIQSSDIAFLDVNPDIGGEQWIEATVHNIGSEDALETTVSFFDGDPDTGGTLIGEARIARIVQGGSHTVHLEPGTQSVTVDVHDWSWLDQPGNHDIYVKAEISDPTREGNIMNNVASKTVLMGHPEIGVTPIFYNFGETKEGYSSKSLVCIISNNGDIDLNISGIVLSDTKNFTLQVDRGPNPCGSTTPTLAPGSNGTFTVTFTPSSDGLKSAILTINSDDPDNSLVGLSFKGKGMPVYAFNTWMLFQRDSLGYKPNYNYSSILGIPDYSQVWNMPNFSKIMGMQNLYVPFNYPYPFYSPGQNNPFSVNQIPLEINSLTRRQFDNNFYNNMENTRDRLTSSNSPSWNRSENFSTYYTGQTGYTYPLGLQRSTYTNLQPGYSDRNHLTSPNDNIPSSTELNIPLQGKIPQRPSMPTNPRQPQVIIPNQPGFLPGRLPTEQSYPGSINRP